MDKDKKTSGKSWRGSWNRPVTVDESSYDALTIARMSDHNVRGNDRDTSKKSEVPKTTNTKK